VTTHSMFAVAGLALVLSACGEASASSSFDPTNPLHCAAQFESYHILAKQMGDEKSATHYGFRSQWYAKRARSLPKEQRTTEALTELGNSIAAAPDGGLALATECAKRQEADPSFPRVQARHK
jgi:hypothetical protein